MSFICSSELPKLLYKTLMCVDAVDIARFLKAAADNDDDDYEDERTK